MKKQIKTNNSNSNANNTDKTNSIYVYTKKDKRAIVLYTKNKTLICEGYEEDILPRTIWIGEEEYDRKVLFDSGRTTVEMKWEYDEQWVYTVDLKLEQFERAVLYALERTRTELRVEFGYGGGSGRLYPRLL